VTESSSRERVLPPQAGVLDARPELGGAFATPSFADASPDREAQTGLARAPAPMRVRARTFAWGSRTFVAGILNVTPDSFSGDGLLAAGPSSADPVRERAVELARRMADEGADLLDIGGESSRPGHPDVDADEERRRVVPVVAAVRAALPDLPISVDTVKPSVALAAIQAGADLLNDVWGVAEDDSMARLAAEHGVPLIVMHNRAEARYRNLLAEVIADLERALERAVRAGVDWQNLIVDPGFGFGKAPVHNLALLRGLGELRVLGRPIMLGTSRKSTLGKVLDLPADQRLEATLATTALGIASGVDLVRVHDVRANARVARMSDAVLRGTPAEWLPEGDRT
jgi:dihydropteroate synthase